MNDTIDGSLENGKKTLAFSDKRHIFLGGGGGHGSDKVWHGYPKKWHGSANSFITCKHENVPEPYQRFYPSSDQVMRLSEQEHKRSRCRYFGNSTQCEQSSKPCYNLFEQCASADNLNMAAFSKANSETSRGSSSLCTAAPPLKKKRKGASVIYRW